MDPRPPREIKLDNATFGILIAAALAGDGNRHGAAPFFAVVGSFIAAVVFAFTKDFVKVPVFRRLAIG